MARIIPLYRLPVFSIVDPPDPSFPFAKGAAFLIHKPAGWSSHKVVKHLRKHLNMRKVGHAGTLDPMATGLLVVCCGKGTRTISQIQHQPKKYRAEVTFGTSTPSYDATTCTAEQAPWQHISREDVEHLLKKEFTGRISQLPPMYSALKHKGTPLYKLARKGKEVERSEREIMLYATQLLSFKLPRVELYIRCSKGTYIRSIAHDLGQKLQSAAHLTALQRTAIGTFRDEDALTLEDLNLIFNSPQH